MGPKYSENNLKQVENQKDPNLIPDLVKELRESYKSLEKIRNDRLEKYTYLLLSDASTYHNHKETMAHAAFLVEVALFGAIMTMNKWPPAWIPSSYVSARILAFIGFFIIWIIIHVFIRWQLRNRRWAAIQCAGIIRAIRKWINEPPKNEDFKPYKSSSGKLSNKLDFLDFIITWPKAKIIDDVGNDGEPSGIVECILEQEKIGTGAIRAEFILTFGSILIPLFVLFRTCFGQ